MKKCEVLAKGSLYDLFFACIHAYDDMEEMRLINNTKRWIRSHPGSKAWAYIFFSPYSLILYRRITLPDLGFRLAFYWQTYIT